MGRPRRPVLPLNPRFGTEVGMDAHTLNHAQISHRGMHGSNVGGRTVVWPLHVPAQRRVHGHFYRITLKTKTEPTTTTAQGSRQIVLDAVYDTAPRRSQPTRTGHRYTSSKGHRTTPERSILLGVKVNS